MAIAGSLGACLCPARALVSDNFTTLRLPSSSYTSFRCSARRQHEHGSLSHGAQSSTRAAAESPFPLPGLVVPMLAAALVGSSQPAVEASEWDKSLVAVDSTENLSGDSTYKDLLQRIKEKRAKGTTTPPAPTEEKSDTGASTYSSPYYSPPPVYSPPPPVYAPTPQVTRAADPTPVEIPQKEKQVVAEVEAARRQKTHGSMPLFLSQFLLLVATLGGGYAFITTPQSKWDEVEKKVNEFTDKATPLVEDALAKAQPIASQTQKKVQEFAETAQPYVAKAWEASKPLAAKAVEASKPVLKGAQAKAAELLQQAQDQSKV